MGGLGRRTGFMLTLIDGLLDSEGTGMYDGYITPGISNNTGRDRVVGTRTLEEFVVIDLLSDENPERFRVCQRGNLGELVCKHARS